MWYDKTAMTLASIGAINWGLNILEWNAIEMLLGWTGMFIVNLIYTIIAISGIYTLFLTFKN